jgi:lipoprotein-anchoring transpeptidase ErfK/SrfK
MANLRSVIQRFGLRIGAVLVSFSLVGGFILVQQQREAWAAQTYQSAHQAALSELAHAGSLGLTPGEISDLQRQELTADSAVVPSGTPPFNEQRIDFYNREAAAEQQVTELLQAREAQLLGQTRNTAQDDLVKLIGGLQEARQLGVDQDALMGLLPPDATSLFNHAATVRDYRALSAELTTPLQKLALLIADQQATNKLIGSYVAAIAAQDHGDPGTARRLATTALNVAQADLRIATTFKMDVSLIQVRVDKLGSQIAGAQTVQDLERIGGALQAHDHLLQQAMSQALPEKAITISLTEQVLRAYDHGQMVFWTYVTTGRPGLETDKGSFKVYWKVSPWTMHSPWPKSSPYWYPDSKVTMVMWFNGGDGIHDAYWRSVYGPGTEYPHYDPTGEDNGTHGCVNVPYSNMLWLWNWTPTGTPVIVY